MFGLVWTDVAVLAIAALTLCELIRIATGRPRPPVVEYTYIHERETEKKV